MLEKYRCHQEGRDLNPPEPKAIDGHWGRVYVAWSDAKQWYTSELLADGKQYTLEEQFLAN